MGPRSYVPSLFRRRPSTLPFLRGASPGAPPRPATTVHVEPEPSNARWSFADAEAVARARREHPRAYEPWTHYEEQRLLLELKAGRPAEAVARSLGRPESAVRKRAARLAKADDHVASVAMSSSSTFVA